MKIKLIRHYKTKDFTLGTFLIDDVPQCFTVEDTIRDKKIYGKTCIPFGTYEIDLRTEGGFYQRMKKICPYGMLHLQNVPNFKYILIHSGNDVDDTHGCILTTSSLRNNGFGGAFYQSVTKNLHANSQSYITL